MFEEARLPLYDPALYEECKNKEQDKKNEKQETVVILDISPKDESIIDI